MDVAPGDAVLTKFGAGVVVRCLDDAGGVISTRQDAQGGATAPAWVSVRLWRQPGRSIASCATSTLRLDCIVKKLVAAPGMTVRASTAEGGAAQDEEKEEDDRELYLIERYLPSKDEYLASSVDGGNGKKEGLARSLAVISNDTSGDGEGATACRSEKRYYQLQPHQIVASSGSAKFYPVLEDLMARGEAAWSLAVEKSNENAPELAENVSNVADRLSTAVTITSPDRKKASVANFISDTSKSSVQTLNEKLANASNENGDVANINAKQALDTAADKATAATTAATAGLSMPQTNEIKQIYKMLRDDDLTELFTKGRERLMELVESEIPTRTKNALGAMGIELEDEEAIEDGKKSIRGGIGKLRKEALASLDQILKMNVSEDGKIVVQTGGNDDAASSIEIDTKSILDPSLLPSSSTNVKELMDQAQAQFSNMFDHLSDAASSDSQLMQIFSGISDKTKQWQEMTGRIMETKTASLFMEGSRRLQTRAAEMLNLAPGQLRDAFGGDGGANGDLTRAFTEGDVAMAKLKSMEMGDAIRQRLFAAIELRSESSGGLDSIIAGSLAAIQRGGDEYGSKAAGLLGKKGLEDLSLSSAVGAVGSAASACDGVSEDSVQSVIANLQQSATSTMSDTKETLIAMLSHRSGYRDAVLLRLEQVFLDLESTLGQDMSAEEIARLASGEGGTLALFQPVAMKAAKEIETQLVLAEEKMKESKHWDPRMDDVLQKVRKIMSGELSMSDIIDIAAGFLDDEAVVAKSGGLIVKAESLLDDFEAASARLADAGKASRAMGGDASAGIMDAVAKAGITKDTVMKGVEGLDVNKLLDNTQSAVTDEEARRELISSAGDTALDFLLKILPEMPVPPFDGVREGLVYHLSNLSLAGFKVKKEDIYIEIAGIRAAAQDPTESKTPRAVKASELLIIDVKNISATLDDAMWSFEQTYMPYLKGQGKANARLWDGAIRLKFEVRRRLNEDKEWEPVLCLSDRTCSIGGVELVIQGESKIAWVANKLVSYLKGPLRDYVVSVIIDVLKNHSGWLIDMLNSNLSNYWDFIMRTANLELSKLPKLAKHHVIKAEPDAAEDEVELVWRERVPLGLNILTNDESGYLKIIDLPRGTQARKVAQSKQLDPDIFKGSTIVSVNGKRYGPDNQVDLFAALKDPARPKSILFKLASQDDAKRMDEIANFGGRATKNQHAEDEKEGADLVTVVDIIDEGDIGLKFASCDNFALAVSDSPQERRGKRQPAKRTGKIAVGDLLSHINGQLVLGEKGEGKQKALALLEQVGSKRPLSLGFVKPYLHNIVLEKDPDASDAETFGGPDELVFEEVKAASSNESKIVLKDFAPTEGAAETGGVFVGDNLAFINGIPVGAGCRLLAANEQSPKLDVVIDMLKQLSPLAVTFARAQAKKTSTVKSYLTSSPLSLDIESAYTFSVAVPDYSLLGCKFKTGMNGSDIVVKEIGGVEGMFQRQMRASKHPLIGCKLESVDGEVAPSYANPSLILNAMKRRWASNGRVELTFCNERQRDSLRKVESLDNAA